MGRYRLREIGLPFAESLVMKLTAVIVFTFCAFMLGACSPGDNERAREEAHQTADQVKHDSRVVLHEAEAGAQKASREVDRGLEKTREKVRQALDEPADRRDNDDKNRP
jgi:hypothetical protein